MPAIPLHLMDDFVLSNLPDYDKMKWEDWSIPLQKTLFKYIVGKAKPAEQAGDRASWDYQFDYDDNFAPTGPHDPDTSSRKAQLGKGEIFWSFFKTNYTYDIRETLLNKEPVAIIKWIDEKEHGLMNSFWVGMEKQLFGSGPTTAVATDGKPPMCSLAWWLPAYNANSTNQNLIGTLASGVTSDFLGADPAGFSAVGTGGISRVSVAEARHRVGTYNVFSEDDALDTILECMDKCNFTPAQAYSELTPSENPDWMLLTTYSRLKLARRISSSQNDNLKGNLTRWKDTVLINGVPLQWVPAWTSSKFGIQRTDGPVMGINWKTWRYYTMSSLNMVKSPPEKDKDNHLGRWRYLDHSCQLVLLNPRGNFVVNYGGTGSITEND
jgi:hypothetical protein